MCILPEAPNRKVPQYEKVCLCICESSKDICKVWSVSLLSVCSRLGSLASKGVSREISDQTCVVLIRDFAGNVIWVIFQCG